MRKQSKGFTLSEVVVTVALVGTVTAISVPNYLRIKMEMNMEMVKQHMRVIGEKMIETFGKRGQFPNPSQWPFTGSFDPDEQVITANLDAIDDLCYTTNQSDYIVNQERDQFVFCSQRKTDPECRWAGSKRFCVHCNTQMSQYFAPGVVGQLPEFQPNNGSAMAITGWHSGNFFNPSNMSYFLTDPNLTDQKRVEILTAWIEYEAYSPMYAFPSPPVLAGVTWTPGTTYATTTAFFTDSYQNPASGTTYAAGTISEKFNSLFPQVAQALYLKGINIYEKNGSTSGYGWQIWANPNGSSYCDTGCNGQPAYYGHSGTTLTQIGFSPVDSSLTQAVITSRLPALEAQILSFQTINPYYGWSWGTN